MSNIYGYDAFGGPLKKWSFTTDGQTFKNNMITMRGSMLGGGDLYESGLEGIMEIFLHN